MKATSTLWPLAAIAAGVFLLRKAKPTSGVGDNRITKKYIQSVLRTKNPTEIFRLYKQIYGNIDRAGLYDFIIEYAPTNNVARAAWNIAYGSRDNSQVWSNHDEWNRQQNELNRHGSFAPLKKQQIVNLLEYYLKDPLSPYAKRPVKGRSGLWFMSPIHMWDDYNKSRVLDWEGNEDFCEAIVRRGDSVFDKYYQKQKKRAREPSSRPAGET